MSVECKSTVTAEPGDYLTAAEIAAWIVGVPASAQVAPVLREYGSQRDPITVLGGLIAHWTEER